MTDLPPQPLDSSAFVPSPSPRWPTCVAWVVIWLAVGFLVVGNVLPEIRGRKHSVGGGEDMQMEVTAKYVVGARSLLHGPPGPMVEQIDYIAKTPKAKLQAAAVAGELEDQNAALQRLKKVDLKNASDETKRDAADLTTIYTAGPDSLDQAARDRLEQHLGYIGKLAVTFGKNDSDPLRQSVLQMGKKTMIALVLAFVVIIFAGVIGLGLLILALVLFLNGKLPLAYRPQFAAPGVYVEMFAVYLASFILFSVLLSFVTHGEASLKWSWALSIVLPLAIFYGLLRGISWTDMRQGLGWHGGRGFLIELPLGLAGYVAGLPVIMLGFGVTYVLLRFSGVTPSHPVQNLPTNTTFDVLQLFGIACVWAPVIEETMFRGALFNHMRRRWNWIISASLVALIFAAIHPQGWTFIPVLGAIAIVLAGIREWRGSILASMAAHACNNFLMICLLLAVK